MGWAQGPVEWQCVCVLVARVWHTVTAEAPVGSWASVGAGKKGGPFPWVQLGPTGLGPHVTTLSSSMG